MKTYTFKVVVEPDEDRSREAALRGSWPCGLVVYEAMVESVDYFFFAPGLNESATAFRSEIGHMRG